MLRRASLLLLLLLSWTASAEEARPAAPIALPDVKDALFKGVVGKALDKVPMDPGERVVLQRTNAVLSGTLTGRSLAAWAGLSNPILLVGGLAWGLYSAYNIRENRPQPRPEPVNAEPLARFEMAWAQAPQD